MALHSVKACSIHGRSTFNHTIIFCANLSSWISVDGLECLFRLYSILNINGNYNPAVDKGLWEKQKEKDKEFSV